METYAVIWWREGRPLGAGKVEIGAAEARFSGRHAEPLAVALDDVVDTRIARSGGSPGGGLPTLVVRLRDGGSVSVQSIVGYAVLHELADLLAPPHPQAA
jgi:hypothetical protein